MIVASTSTDDPKIIKMSFPLIDLSVHPVDMIK